MTMLRETWDKCVIARDLLAICSIIYIWIIWCVCTVVWVNKFTNKLSFVRSFDRLNERTEERSINHFQSLVTITHWNPCYWYARMTKSINQSNRNFAIEQTLAVKTKIHRKSARNQMQFDNDIIFICSLYCLSSSFIAILIYTFCNFEIKQMMSEFFNMQSAAVVVVVSRYTRYILLLSLVSYYKTTHSRM